MTEPLIDHDNLEEFRAPDDFDAEHGALDADGAFMVAFAVSGGGPLGECRVPARGWCPPSSV